MNFENNIFEFEIKIAKVANGYTVVMPTPVDDNGNPIEINGLFNDRFHVFVSHKEALDFVSYKLTEIEDSFEEFEKEGESKK